MYLGMSDLLNSSLDTQDTDTTIYGSIEDIKIIDDKVASLQAADLNVSDSTDYMNIPGLQASNHCMCQI